MSKLMEYSFCFVCFCAGMFFIIIAQQTKIGIMPELHKLDSRITDLNKEVSGKDELLRTMLDSVDEIYVKKEYLPNHLVSNIWIKRTKQFFLNTPIPRCSPLAFLHDLFMI